MHCSKTAHCPRDETRADRQRRESFHVSRHYPRDAIASRYKKRPRTNGDYRRPRDCRPKRIDSFTLRQKTEIRSYRLSFRDIYAGDNCLPPRRCAHISRCAFNFSQLIAFWDVNHRVRSNTQIIGSRVRFKRHGKPYYINCLLIIRIFRWNLCVRSIVSQLIVIMALSIAPYRAISRTNFSMPMNPAVASGPTRWHRDRVTSRRIWLISFLS